MGLGLYAWQVEPHWVELVERPLPLAGLPRELLGTTLVQSSDLHVGALGERSLPEGIAGPPPSSVPTSSCGRRSLASF